MKLQDDALQVSVEEKDVLRHCVLADWVLCDLQAMPWLYNDWCNSICTLWQRLGHWCANSKEVCIFSSLWMGWPLNEGTSRTALETTEAGRSHLAVPKGSRQSCSLLALQGQKQMRLIGWQPLKWEKRAKVHRTDTHFIYLVFPQFYWDLIFNKLCVFKVCNVMSLT